MSLNIALTRQFFNAELELKLFEKAAETVAQNLNRGSLADEETSARRSMISRAFILAVEAGALEDACKIIERFGADLDEAAIRTASKLKSLEYLLEFYECEPTAVRAAHR